jgi:hypothetical protein
MPNAVCSGIKEYKARYYREHLADIKEKSKAYYLSHKKERLDYLRRWQAKNRDRIRTKGVEYREANKKLISAQKKRYYQDNRDECIAKSHKRYVSVRKSPEWAYQQYKGRAKSRGIEFSLTMKQFMEFWQKPCYYSGLTIETIGLDRIDNSKGYIYGNVVSCHHRCNTAKNTMTRDEFISLCGMVVKLHGGV